MDKPKPTEKIEILLLHMLERDLNDIQKEELLRWSKECPDAEQIYCDFLTNYAIIKSKLDNQVSISYGCTLNSEFDQAIFQSLLEDEKNSPKVEHVAERELIQKVLYPPKQKRKISKFNIFLIVNVAAILFFLVVLNIMPQTDNGKEVAVLTDTIDAVWDESGLAIEDDMPLVAGESKLILKEGAAEITFDSRAVVLIEAPAEIQIVALNRLALSYGKVYATVPSQASGFTVCTPDMDVVDLGTEFGVQAGGHGSSQLHVMKGKVQLYTGNNSESRKSQLIKSGKAIIYDAYSKTIKDIPLKENNFIRAIDSKYNTVWRCEPAGEIKLDFQGLTENQLPEDWVLVDNCLNGIGPAYINSSDSGPGGIGDTCGRVLPENNNLEMENTGFLPGGWIACTKFFDAANGFEGSFDFMLNTGEFPDAVFIFGDALKGAGKYYNCNLTQLAKDNQLYVIENGFRKLVHSVAVTTPLVPQKWYQYKFRFEPTKETTGLFSYTVTDLKGGICYSENGIETTLPKKLTFGIGNYNDSANFDNIKISSLSNSKVNLQDNQ